jgi:hypothetical protein
MYYGNESAWTCRRLLVKRQDRPYPSHLLGGERVHGLHGQDAVALAHPFLQLTDSFVRLLLGCAEDPVDPGFEVGGSTF